MYIFIIMYIMLAMHKFIDNSKRVDVHLSITLYTEITDHLQNRFYIINTYILEIFNTLKCAENLLNL